jgi:integrase
MNRQQLPPQIRKIDVRSNGKTVVRYELRVDGGVSAATGKRQQVKRRFDTERAARIALADVSSDASTSTFVARSVLTVDTACADFLAGRYNLRPTSGSKLAYDLAPLIERYGDMPVQALTKANLDALIGALVKGGTVTGKGRLRRPWSAVSINKAIDAWAMVLDDAHRQGLTVRNVAEHVSHVAVRHHDVDTYTGAEVQTILASIGDDRIGHAWELALSGLRRGEIAGLRWGDVDLDARTLTIANNRVAAGSKTVEGDPKSAKSRRTLPLPDRLVVALKAAKRRQAAERLAVGPAYALGAAGAYVVSNELGDPYSPGVLSHYWRDAVAAAGLRHIKLHAARHTAATLMHLSGVPVAVIAAWIGHSDPSLTLRLYAHSQDDALRAAATSLDRVVNVVSSAERLANSSCPRQAGRFDHLPNLSATSSSVIP